MSSTIWRIDGARLRALRMAQMMTIEELAVKSGYDARSIAAIERGERSPRPGTIRCIAEALGVAPEELLARETPATPAVPAPPQSTTAVIALKLPARTNLDRLADLTTARGIVAKLIVVGQAKVELLLPPRMQDLFARHLAFNGKRFVVEGIVDRPRAFSKAEARALGGKVGVGARFHILAEAAPGIPFSVTVHAVSAKLADALQAKKGERARMVVTVRVVGKNDARVVTLFASERKRAWAFVVTAVS